MKKLNPDYVVGLVDGEGSFTAYVRDPGSKNYPKRRVRVEPRFYVKLVEKDKIILFQLKNFFGCGSVYFQKDTRPNHQHCYRYEVYNRDDLERVIIPFFKQNALRLPSKGKDFELFCGIIKAIKRNDHMTDTGLRKIRALKVRMH